MILVINGPFGIGKSSAAALVANRLPGHLFDPEVVGSIMGSLGVQRAGEDFRDLPLWRDLTVAAVASLRQHAAEHLVVPMNLLKSDVHEDLVARWSQIDSVVTIRLTSSPSTLRNRILSRPDADGPHDWCLAHLDTDIEAVADPRFGTEVSTEDSSVQDVAARILEVITRAS